METASSTLSVLPNNKAEVENFANKLISEIENGQINPLELLRQQRAIEKVFDLIKDSLTKAARDEAEKYGVKSFEFKGAKFELAEAGVKYDYSQSGHVGYSKISESIAKLNEKKKEFETFIKAVKEPVNLVDEDSGEVFTVYPPQKTSTSTIKITL